MDGVAFGSGLDEIERVSRNPRDREPPQGSRLLLRPSVDAEVEERPVPEVLLFVPDRRSKDEADAGRGLPDEGVASRADVGRGLPGVRAAKRPDHGTDDAHGGHGGSPLYPRRWRSAGVISRRRT